MMVAWRLRAAVARVGQNKKLRNESMPCAERWLQGDVANVLPLFFKTHHTAMDEEANTGGAKPSLQHPAIAPQRDLRARARHDPRPVVQPSAVAGPLPNPQAAASAHRHPQKKR